MWRRPIDPLLTPGFGLGRFRPRQHVSRLLPGQHAATGIAEYRQHRNIGLGTSYRIPGNPNAVGGANLGGAEMLFELLGREGEAFVRDLAGSLFVRVIESIHDQLSIDRDGFFFGVVEVDSPAKAARRCLARLRVHRWGPDHHHLHRLLEDRLFILVVSHPGKFAGEIGQRRLAAARGQEERGQQQPAKTDAIHGIVLDRYGTSLGLVDRPFRRRIDRRCRFLETRWRNGCRRQTRRHWEPILRRRRRYLRL
jgi:hypothetical protein